MTPRYKISRFLNKKSGHYYYQQYIPNRFSHVNSRKCIQYILHAASIEVARMYRDALTEAVLEFWTAFALEAAKNGGLNQSVSPVITVSEALEICLSKITFDEIKYKSEKPRCSWEKLRLKWSTPIGVDRSNI